MMEVIGTFTFEFEVSLPLVATKTFHSTGTTYGWLLGAFGAGAVADGLYAARSACTGVARLTKTALAYAIAVGLLARAEGTGWHGPNVTGHGPTLWLGGPSGPGGWAMPQSSGRLLRGPTRCPTSPS